MIQNRMEEVDTSKGGAAAGPAQQETNRSSKRSPRSGGKRSSRRSGSGARFKKSHDLQRSGLGVVGSWE